MSNGQQCLPMSINDEQWLAMSSNTEQWAAMIGNAADELLLALLLRMRMQLLEQQ